MHNINRLLPIWEGLACNNRWTSYIRREDVETFARRSAGEGAEFYARGFASLRASFLAGFETGKWEVKGRFGRKVNSVLPRFLYGATSRVFSDDGTLLPVLDIDVEAVACVNQLLAVFTKLKGGHTPQSEIDVIESFVNTEKEIASTFIDLDVEIHNVYLHGQLRTAPLGDIVVAASRLVRRVLAGSDPREILPSHGSGASACRTPIRARYAAPNFVDKIDKVWPMDQYYFTWPNAFCDGLREYTDAPVLDPCARVLLVPKDARGPRLISCEPKETMWIQQGLMGLLYKTIEGHALTRWSVKFTDQSYNQVAARLGSKPPNGVPVAEISGRCSPEKSLRRRSDKDLVRHKTRIDGPSAWTDDSTAGKLATLDLKDASDRIRLDVVHALFPGNWSEALTACRSDRTELPDGRLVTMNKHAPMGSAVCFPVMALVIWSVLTAIAPKSERKLILVYGDDIVVPSHLAKAATQVLEAVGLKVNVNKSFTRGPFRESCGKEYFLGTDITPVRLRQYPDNNVESLMKCIAFSNNYSLQQGYTPLWLVELLAEWYGWDNLPTMPLPRGDLRISMYWDSTQQQLVRSVVPGQASRSGVLFSDYYDTKRRLRRRWNKHLQRWEFHIRVAQPRVEKFDTADWCHVLRSLVKPSASILGADPVHNRVRYVRRWVTLE